MNHLPESEAAGVKPLVGPGVEPEIEETAYPPRPAARLARPDRRRGLALALPFALRAGAEFFLPVTAALVIAIALVPMLEWLERRRVPSALAALICVILFIAIANVAVAAIVFPATEWFRLLPERIGQMRETLAPARRRLFRPRAVHRRRRPRVRPRAELGAADGDRSRRPTRCSRSSPPRRRSRPSRCSSRCW